MSIQYGSMEDQLLMLNTYIKQVSRSLKHKPPGSLNIVNMRGYTRFYYRNDPQAKCPYYLSKEKKALIQSLAQKDYEQQFLDKARDLRDQIEQYIKSGLERNIGELYQDLAGVYSGLSASRRELVSPIVKPDAQFIEDWEAVEYEGNTSYPMKTPFFTERGEQVRSKSEKIIADKLLSLNIPYRYEYPHELDTGDIVYPDFTILLVRERREVILEHLGSCTNPEYCLKNLKKITKYLLSGYQLGYDLLITFEADEFPLDTRLAEKLLKEFFK